MTKTTQPAFTLLMQIAKDTGLTRSKRADVDEEMSRLKDPEYKKKFNNAVKTIAMNTGHSGKLRLIAFNYLNAVRKSPAKRKKSK